MNIHNQLRLKNKALKMTSVASFLLLAACSGGGGGGEPAAIAGIDAQPAPSVPPIVSPEASEPETAPAPESTTPPAVTPEPEPELEPESKPEPVSTADLEASSNFVFGTSYTLPLNVDLSSRLTSDALLVVCENFTEVGGRFEVNYSDCILRAPLTNGMYQGTLKLTNDTEKLIAAVWTYEENSEPEYHSWSLTNNPDGFFVR